MVSCDRVGARAPLPYREDNVLGHPGTNPQTSGSDSLLRTGRVSFGGIVKEISLAYTPEAKVGDYVIVHVGFALSIVDEKEAQRVFDYLQEIGELEELRS